MVDEAYSDFVLDSEKFTSAAAIDAVFDNVFIVNSLSKNMGMSGWRIGYVMSSEKNISALMVLNQHLVTCAPTILQYYLARYFNEIIDLTLPQVRETVRIRNRIMAYLDQKGVEYLKGNSTFYIFIKIDDSSISVLNFCLYLLFKYGIATVPGIAYGNSTGNFIRIGIGVESEERIRQAIDIIVMVAKNKSADERYVEKKLNVNKYHRFEVK